MPRLDNAFSICLMSSLTNKLVILVVPFANAAMSNARLDKLFEPGKKTSPLILLIGFNVNCSIVSYFPVQICS